MISPTILALALQAAHPRADAIAGQGNPPPAASARMHIRTPPAAQRRPVRYETHHGQILFRMTIAGREAWVLLDTGASSTFIDTRFAQEAGLAFGQGTGSIRTPNGAMPVRQVRDIALDIPGHLDVRLPTTAAMDLSQVTAVVGRRIDAVLGWEIMRRLVLTVDPAARTFELTWPDAAPAMPGAATIPFNAADRTIVMQAGDHALTLLIDTGNTGVVGLKPDVWTRVAPAGATTRAEQSRDATGSYTTRIGALPQMRLGRATLGDVPVVIGPLRSVDADGYLGMGLLHRLRFAVDPLRGEFRFMPATPTQSGGGAQAQPATPPPPSR